jgi:hypothetical protein
MSINSSFAIKEESTRRFGKLYGTIDFETTPVSRDQILVSKSDTVVGVFTIGSEQYRVSISELDRIADTAMRAKEVAIKKYTFGIS